MHRLAPRFITAFGLATLLAAVLTGCGAAGSGAATAPPTSHSAPTTDVAITYPIRSAIGPRSQAVHACPASATCTYDSVGTGSTGAEIWVPIAHLHLTCAPAGGTYRDPAAACRALFDLRHRILRSHHEICMCPMMPGNATTAITGTVDGTMARLNLGACALCGIGPAGTADAGLLMPGS